MAINSIDAEDDQFAYRYDTQLYDVVVKDMIRQANGLQG